MGFSGLRVFGSPSSVFLGGYERTSKTQPFHIVKRYAQVLEPPMKQIITLILMLISINAACQDNDNRIRMQVLESGVIDSLFVFGKWTNDGQTQTELEYIGQIVTDSGKVYKIINSSWIWGLSKRSTNRILIYNDNNEYVGNYLLNMKSDLPERIENRQLIFLNSDKKDCDKPVLTKIDLRKGLPNQIFIKCNETDGDIFVFSTE